MKTKRRRDSWSVWMKKKCEGAYEECTERGLDQCEISINDKQPELLSFESICHNILYAFSKHRISVILA